MMSRNQGMLKWFRQTLSFEDWGSRALSLSGRSPGRTTAWCRRRHGPAARRVSRAAGLRGWANARDVISMAERLSFHRADRVCAKEEVVCYIKADVDAAVDEFAGARKAEAAYAQAKEELMKRLGAARGTCSSSTRHSSSSSSSSSSSNSRRRHSSSRRKNTLKTTTRGAGGSGGAGGRRGDDRSEKGGGRRPQGAADGRGAQTAAAGGRSAGVQEALEAQTRLNEQRAFKRRPKTSAAARGGRGGGTGTAAAHQGGGGGGRSREAEASEELRWLAAEKQRLERRPERRPSARRAREAAERARGRNESARMRAVLNIGCAAGYGHTKVSGGALQRGGARGSHFVSDSQVDSSMR